MKYYLTILFFVITILSVEAQIKRALIIGIGNYPIESGWCKIHGDNDVPLINDILTSKGFSTNNIKCLTNENATRKNIVKSFNQLIKQSQSNDILYIHFSTHGQQIVDTDGDEADGLDEAIIPFDAQKTFVKGAYEGKNHLIDDELNLYLTSLRKKIGKAGSLLVVIDACHSGDATRGNDDGEDSVIVRGTADIFQAVPKRSYVPQPPKSQDWVVISACQSYQNNYEYKVNGTFYGSLSYAIKLTLPDLTNGDDFANMFKMLQKRREEMNVARYPQRPMIEGDSFYLNQKVF